MRRAALFVLAILGPFVSRAATLSASDQAAAPGETILVPIACVSLPTDLGISGIQFDLRPAAPLSLQVFPGRQVGASTKLFYTAALPENGVRVLVIGLNRELLADGDVARLLINVDPNAAAGDSQIAFSNVMATSPDGVPIALAAAPLTVHVAGGPALQAFSKAGVLNSASLLPGPVSPGEIFTVFGGPGLAGTTDVLFGGAKSAVLYAGAAQLNAVAPFGLDPASPANLDIRVAGRSLGSASVDTAPVNPALFTVSSNGVGPGVILNQDYSVNSYTNPAQAGSVIVLYGTGFGALLSPANDGEASPGAASTVLPVTATIAGLPADVFYAGAAPGFIAGVVQINVRIPDGVAANQSAPVVLQIGNATTPPGVTVSVD